jgi:hypothetical protein
MGTLSKRIGIGVQTFRIMDIDRYFTLVKDLGPDYNKFLDSRKIVKLKCQDVYYALVGVPDKDMEEFVVRINTDLESLDGSEFAATTEKWQ